MMRDFSGVFKCWLVILLLNVFALSVNAQDVFNFKGKIVEKDNALPIPYATGFIQETSRGFVADSLGCFNIKLGSGKYNVEFRSLGYESINITIDLSADTQFDYVVSMSPASFMVGDAVVVGKKPKEDPAYPIMRRFFTRVPIYERIAQSYNALTYYKGSFKLNKLPALISHVKSEGIAVKEMVGKRFVVERHVATEFEAPNSYKNHVLAFRTSMPEQFAEQEREIGEVINIVDIYGENLFGLHDSQSPFRRGAFAYYTYKLEGRSKDNDKTLYHISFESKHGKDKGRLVLIENSWILHSMEMSIHKDMFSFDIMATLSEVSNNIYLPTTSSLNAKFSAFGIKLDLSYAISSSYSDFVPNEVALSELKALPEVSGTHQSYKLSKKIEHKLDTLGYNFSDRYRLPVHATVDSISVDSLSRTRDSIYWDVIMNNPLTNEEQLSYIKKDSIDKAFAQKRERTMKGIKDKTRKRGVVGKILVGDQIKIKDAGRVDIAGLSSVFRDYNYADRFVLGTQATLYYKLSDTMRFSITPKVAYSTKRKNLMFELNGVLSYSPLRRGLFAFEMGRNSRSIDSYTSYNPKSLNMFATFIDGRGFVKLFDKSYIKFKNSIDIFNGLKLDGGIEFHRSKPLEEGKVWGLFNKKPIIHKLLSWNNAKSDDLFYPDLLEHNSLKLHAKLWLNPSPYYRIYSNNYKVYDGEGIRSPLFALEYNGAIPLGDKYSNYHHFDISAQQKIHTDYGFSISYHASVGMYLSDEKIYADDAFYLKGINTPIVDGENVFHTVSPFTAKRGEHLTLFSNLTSNNLLVGRFVKFPGLRPQESLYFKGYWQMKTKKPYLELGYSLQFMDVASIGIYIGGANLFPIQGCALRIGLNL